MNEVLAQKIKDLPKNSGVYIMFDRYNTIIYIGKAKVLANRVRQYFQNSVKTEKVAAMVSNVADFSYIITATELDALALESNLIKKHKPYYNILLKDDRSHPYIRIDFRQKYPTIEIVRKVKSDGAKYWGPYFGGIRVAEIAELIQSAFCIRTCRGNSWPKRHRECMNYHIELCSAPCCGKITPEEYRKQLDKAAAFMSGNDDEIRALLLNRMKLAAENEKFEQALVYRDRLKNLERIGKKIITNIPKSTNMDVFGYATNNQNSSVSVQIVRAGKTISCDNYIVQDASFSPAECVSSFLVQYYDGARGLPDEIILDELPQDIETVKEYFFGKYKHRPAITVPKIGVKRQLLKTCALNASDYLEKSRSTDQRKDDMTYGAVRQLQQFLSLPKPPMRIECYDISNISGVDKVASMVVFVGGAPERQQYRRFKIKTVEGADDFASMKEVLSRRLERAKADDCKFGAPPDLIVVDGGKGQLSSAVEAMNAVGTDYPIISLAKKEEEVFTVGSSEPAFIPRSSFALKLLQRIRDEAHRFAITFHRSLRSKHTFESKLEEIPGVGKERRLALMSHFKNIESIKNAGIAELMKVDLISTHTAKVIYDFFHSGGEDK